MAKLDVTVAGLHFPNPIIAGAGPQVDGPEALLATLQGGAGGLTARTMLKEPFIQPPEPSVVPYSRDGILTSQRGSPRTLTQWGVPPVIDVPVIASLAGEAREIGGLGARLVAGGASALEVSTAFLAWEDAVAAIQALRRAVAVPIIAKLSLRHGEDIADRAAEVEPYVDAFTCIGGFGPVIDIDVDKNIGASRLGDPWGYGWLSGGPIHPIAVRTVFEVARRVKKPVIASGGAMTVRDVVEFLEVGASLVQVTTGAILKGPSIYGELARGLSNWLDEHGYSSVADIQGLYLKRYGHGQRVVLTTEEAPMLDESKCTGCTICGQVCYYDAINAHPKQMPVIDPALCFQCGLCVSACPDGALSFRPRAEVTMLPGR